VVLDSLAAVGESQPDSVQRLGPMAEPDELLTVAEIITELKINQPTLRDWI
jgi:hypothetical protein